MNFENPSPNEAIRCALATASTEELIPEGSIVTEVCDGVHYVEDINGKQQRIELVRTVHLPKGIILGEN